MKNILSLCDGISGAQLALKRAKIKYDNYFASEIDDDAISITTHNFPNTKQIGDITNINPKKLPKIFLLIAGSPCQDFSMAGKRKGMITSDNIEITSLNQYINLKKKNHKFHGQSFLFWETVHLIKTLKPKYFIVENVRMNNKWKYIFSKELGVLPLTINSNVLSIQNRERYYWTNIKMPPLKPKNIPLSNVIPNAIGGFGTRGRFDILTKKYIQHPTTRSDNKINCITTKKGNTGKVKLKNGTTRSLTITEAELAQTLPKNYTKVPGISETKRWHGIGNGFTIDVVTHILKGIKKDLDK